MTHLLHVDDDHFYCHTLKRVFEAHHYQVTCAHHGEEGLALVESDPPDVILLDIAMPKKNGFEMLEQLQATKATRAIPVIMLTHLGAKEDVLRCLQLGAVSYLIKTHHSPQDIVQHVDRVVADHRSNGFTMRELLVVIGLIVCAASVGAWLLFMRGVQLRQDQRSAALERQAQTVSVPEAP